MMSIPNKRESLIIGIFVIAIFSAIAWASPSDADFAQCEKKHSRETCVHSLLP
jgi:hypothetical protein